MCFSYVQSLKISKTYLQFFKGQIGCRFVIRHVVVPSAGELEELASLGGLHSDQLLLLSLAHVLELAEHFFVL